jgi:hypothetical protein
MRNDIVVMRILARALLDIRIASHDKNSKISFAIADFVHSIPRQVEVVMEKGGGYDDIMESLVERAKIKNMTSWLNHVINEIEEGRW